MTVGPGIKKLYLVDEEKLLASGANPSVFGEQQQQPFEQQQQQQEGSGSVMSKAVAEQVSNPLVGTVEKQVLLLDAAMREILGKKNVNVRDKLLEYLRTLRRFLMYREQLEKDESSGVANPTELTEGQEQHLRMQQQQSEATASEQPFAAFVEPESVEKYGKQMFSESRMKKNLHKNIRTRFFNLLGQLKDRQNFEWGRDDGVVSVNKLQLPGSNIFDLLLHKVRVDGGERTHDPPPSYYAFEQFLKRHNIHSNDRPRRGPAVSIKQLKREVLKRDKRQHAIDKVIKTSNKKTKKKKKVSGVSSTSGDFLNY